MVGEKRKLHEMNNCLWIIGFCNPAWLILCLTHFWHPSSPIWDFHWPLIPPYMLSRLRWETSPTGSYYVWTLGPQAVALLWEVVEPSAGHRTGWNESLAGFQPDFIPHWAISAFYSEIYQTCHQPCYRNWELFLWHVFPATVASNQQTK